MPVTDSASPGFGWIGRVAVAVAVVLAAAVGMCQTGRTPPHARQSPSRIADGSDWNTQLKLLRRK